ncbi:MAG: hypothetical protein CMA63_01765 [Euryarchaeota archaeon]|nr:hypothetical protein [Euryarchaeota archaeon]
MNRTALVAGSLFVCLLMTLSALAGLAAENHQQAPSELAEIEPMHIGGTDPTSFVALDTSGGVGTDTSIAIDSNDAVHISYYDSSNDDLKYATNTLGYWTSVSIDTSGYVGEFTSIAIDSNDAVHISYYDYTSGDLKYATCSSGCTIASNWDDASVDTSGYVGEFTSIAIDSNDAVHISYYDSSNADLKYAACSSGCTTASNWDDASVDTSGTVGYYTSIAIDSNDAVHISYYDGNGNDLKYATCSSGCTTASNWDDASVDTSGHVGSFTSIAIDSNDAVHISYFDALNADLKYANCSSGCTTASNWDDATVDASGYGQIRTSIAIDSNDAVHISYYGPANDDLKYATCSSGCTTASNWDDASVDTSGDVGGFTSIAIDSKNAVHISYYDYTNHDLKLAYDKDTDFDQVLDKNDACPYNYGTSTEDRIGCIDTDGDGWSDLGDDFHNKATQWKDSDGDGLGDNWANENWNNTRESHWPGEWVANAYLADASPFDFDNDGYEDEDLDDAEEGDGWDACPTLYGTSSEDRSGCIDSDGDGYSNPTTNWGVDDGADEFPGASTQWEDSDEDGYGDNSNGNFPDACVSTYGTSYIDVYGCVDNDGDGYSELNDVDDDDDEEYYDSDGDGYGDFSDAFPYDSTQWTDSDGDGYGDNASGNDPDAFPNDSFEWDDSDGDGYGDNYEDWDPYDATQWEDNDDDGYGDNTSGNNPDMFPNNGEEWDDSDGDGYGDNEEDMFPYDSTQHEDTDEDGYGDNASGNNPDMFPFNDEEWDDSDGDGYGDNEADAFPYDSTQYEDDDNDGYGDNSSGNNPDIFPEDSGEWADTDGDGYGDNYEDYCPYVYGNVSMSYYQGCPDSDGDSYADLEDAFDNDPTQNSDYDGDGYGDNSSGTNPDACPFDFGSSTTTISYNSTTLLPENETAYGCIDSDSDGYDDNTDPCPYSYGNSWVDYFACPDADQDGISDSSDPYPNNATDDIEDWDNDSYLDNAADYMENTDDFPSDSTQWSDSDGDGYGDNPNGAEPDAFPLDWSQWQDSDGDGYGDSPFGNFSDGCIFSSGNSTLDRYGCADSDGDGISNPDGDWSTYDGADAFISDATQWEDMDEDGYGDNSTGNTPDACPSQPGDSSMRAQYTNGVWSNVTEYGCPDEDGDGYEDGSDPCPYTYGNSWFDLLGCVDTDQDGISDISDPYPQTATINTADWDGDGYLDHDQNMALNTDLFFQDATQWFDNDGDGHGDNPNGNSPDMFPNEPSQWQDSDGDGFGDDPNGMNGDHCRFTAGNSTHPNNGCVDSDGDGWADSNDAFTNDNTQWRDTDGDGYGDHPAGNFPDSCPTQPGDSTMTTTPDGNKSHYGCKDKDGDGFDDQSDPCPNQYGSSWIDQVGCADDDGDGISNNEDPEPNQMTNNSEDWDGDGFLDHAENSSRNNDQFPGDSTQWIDTDGDGYGDNQNGSFADAFIDDNTQWMDSDEDGFGDNNEEWANNPDACPYEYGNSSADRLGCIDSDGDGYSDASSTWFAHPFGLADSHPYDTTQWQDIDNDGCGDNEFGNEADAFPNDSTQCADSDGDGFGDNPMGVNPDAFPDDPEEQADSDKDGYGDNTDDFRFDGTQWSDMDADGCGDNENGRDADMFPDDGEQCEDSDGDGYGDNRFVDGGDQFPEDSTQWNDTDGDGYGDNAWGNNADAFPDDPTQWKDWDNDECGDNVVNDDGDLEGGDYFPRDTTQCADRDGDGYGDNQFGSNPDAFPDDEFEWEDADGDGLGDNDADRCLDGETGAERMCINDFDNDGWNDDVDEFPHERTQWIDEDNDGKGDNCETMLIDGEEVEPFNGDCSLNDRDNDGYKDPANPVDSDGNGFPDKDSLECTTIGAFERCEDAFPDDPTEWSDFDDDSIGDNADQDDDGDGFSDVEEMYQGTDSYSAASQPFAGVNVPVVDINLQEWDLITIFIGGPSAIYLAFAFFSRNRRTEDFEDEIHMATSEADLRDISNRYERALQMRLIGPHQGLRLERVRSKRENILEYEMVEQHNVAANIHADTADTAPSNDEGSPSKEETSDDED